MRAMQRMIEQAPSPALCPKCNHANARLAPDRCTDTELAYDCDNCNRIAAEDKWAARQEAAGIPTDVRHATFENFAPGDPRENSDHPDVFVTAARDLLNRRIRNLVIAGPPGVGKGHLTAAICNEAMRQGAKVRWRVVHRLFEALHRGYEDGNRETIIRQHGEIDILVLDEIAMAELPKDGQRSLYDILDMRHKRGCPTILLSNQPAEPIKNWLGPAITDRLRSGRVKFLWADWPSARGNRTKDHAF